MANEEVSFTHNQILGNETITFNLPDLGTELNPCYSFGRNHNQSCIASVICPGVQKCGTTFLYFSLINHPRIAASRGKELNYYLNTSYDGIVHYSDYFIHDSDKILIDFSPKYMMVPESAELIYKTNRNAKFIITLRDPVDRAYSHFRFQQKLYSNDRHIESLLNGPCPRRIEDITFKHYLQEEYHVLTKCSMIDLIHKDPIWPEYKMPQNCTAWNCFKPNHCSKCFPLSNVPVTASLAIGYLSHGLYAKHLQHFFSYFPRENFSL